MDVVLVYLQIVLLLIKGCFQLFMWLFSSGLVSCFYVEVSNQLTRSLTSAIGCPSQLFIAEKQRGRIGGDKRACYKIQSSSIIIASKESKTLSLFISPATDTSAKATAVKFRCLVQQFLCISFLFSSISSFHFSFFSLCLFFFFFLPI